ncbi:hypothetical protein BH11PSE3_BH11PSE3_10320 [soil metagenome]
MRRPAIIAVVVLATAALAGPAWSEMRCGWLQNPTPGNYFLLDSEAEWTAAAQGGLRAKGLDNSADLLAGDYVRTNGYYGYACVCMAVSVDRENKRITRIETVAQKRLDDCRRDPKLPRPPAP